MASDKSIEELNSTSKRDNNVQNSELNDLVTKVELLRIMECPVCQEVPFPPIYQCVRGHNICKNCKPKLKECPTCRGSLTEVRNFTVEQMVLASIHSCCYKNDGCRIELRGELMETHVKNCSYSPFKCPWFGQSGCSTQLRLPVAKDHILKAHPVDQTSLGPTKTILYALSLEYLTDDGSLSLRRLKNPKLLWYPTAIEFDGKMFLFYTFALNTMICFTVSCIGSEEDAQKYHVKIICQPDKELSIQWTAPVNSIVKAAELMKPETRHNVFIPSCTLDDLVHMAEVDEDKLGYRFSTLYTISKRECK